MAKCYKQDSIPQFEPIVLVLETQEEADTVWHRLNMSHVISWLEYRKELGLTENLGIPHSIWKKFDDVHQPNNEV